MSDVIVVGAGLAGLLAAARVSERGHRVTLVTFGVGGLQLSTGCLDVLGYVPHRVADPFAALDAFCAGNPAHPYAVLGSDGVRAGADYARGFFGSARLVSGDANWLLATPVGGLRPTYLAPPTMTPGALDGSAQGDARKVVVAGPAELKDFQPHLIAGNLARVAGLDAAAVSFGFEPRPREVDASALTFARALDDAETARRFARTLKPRVRGASLVYLPALLGLRNPEIPELVREELGTEVAEVALIPPSVPGMRLNDFATAELRRRRVRSILGARVVGLEESGGRVRAVRVATAGHTTTIAAGAVIYAPGGFESGALELDSRGTVREAHLGLPVRIPDGELVTGDRTQAQPLFEAGVAVDDSMRVLDRSGRPLYPNLYAAGGILAGAQRWRELSGDGIAAASAVRAADRIEELA